MKTLPVAIPQLISARGVRWSAMAVVGTAALLPVLVAVFSLQKQIVRVAHHGRRQGLP